MKYLKEVETIEELNQFIDSFKNRLKYTKPYVCIIKNEGEENAITCFGPKISPSFNKSFDNNSFSTIL